MRAAAQQQNTYGLALLPHAAPSLSSRGSAYSSNPMARKPACQQPSVRPPPVPSCMRPCPLSCCPVNTLRSIRSQQTHTVTPNRRRRRNQHVCNQPTRCCYTSGACTQHLQTAVLAHHRLQRRSLAALASLLAAGAALACRSLVALPARRPAAGAAALRLASHLQLALEQLLAQLLSARLVTWQRMQRQQTQQQTCSSSTRGSGMACCPEHPLQAGEELLRASS